MGQRERSKTVIWQLRRLGHERDGIDGIRTAEGAPGELGVVLRGLLEVSYYSNREWAQPCNSPLSFFWSVGHLGPELEIVWKIIWSHIIKKTIYTYLSRKRLKSLLWRFYLCSSAFGINVWTFCKTSAQRHSILWTDMLSMHARKFDTAWVILNSRTPG